MMDSLPPELLTKIVSYLPLDEILKCQQVNSDWNSIIDENIRIKHLVICNQDLYAPKWSFTYQLVDCSNWIKEFNLLDQSMFKNMRQLYIKDLHLDNLNCLNNLVLLQSLEIVDSAIDHFTIHLSNLNHLALLDNKFDEISFDTPNLSHLRIQNNTLLSFNYPKSIKILHVTEYEPEILSLSKLEYLYCEIILEIDSNFLEKLPNLKEVHYNHELDSVQKDVFSSLKQQSNRLNRDLKLFNFGMDLVAIPDADLFAGDLFGNRETSEFIFNNYDKLAEFVHFMYGINYEVLENRFISVPIDFVAKFVNLYSISVEKKLVNLNQFIQFLENYRNLKTLRLSSSSFDQKFIDLLPDRLPNLRYLTVYESIIYDFKPLLNLKNLTFFGTTQNLDDDFQFLHDLFTKIQIEEINCSFLKKNLDIFRENGKYFFGFNEEEDVGYDNLDEMLEELRKLKLQSAQTLEVDIDEMYDTPDVIQLDDSDDSSMEIDDELVNIAFEHNTTDRIDRLIDDLVERRMNRSRNIEVISLISDNEDN